MKVLIDSIYILFIITYCLIKLVEYPVNFDNGFVSGEVPEGTTMYAAAFYWAYIENVIINGFFASSVFIIVCMTIDR